MYSALPSREIRYIPIRSFQYECSQQLLTREIHHSKRCCLGYALRRNNPERVMLVTV